MKKVALLIGLFITCYTSNAQPDDFLFIMEDWYLESLIIDNKNYPIPFNTEISNATIHFVDDVPYTFSARVCGEISGGIDYPTPFSFAFPTPLLLSGNMCSQTVNQDFEDVFFNFFNTDLEFDYEISIVDPGPPNYYIMVTDANGNEAIFTEQPRTLEIEERLKKQYTVFPNPVSEMLFINSNSTTDSHLKILNVQGIILEEKIGTRISMEKYSNGVYFIEITNNEGAIQVEKIIKK